MTFDNNNIWNIYYKISFTCIMNSTIESYRNTPKDTMKMRLENCGKWTGTEWWCTSRFCTWYHIYIFLLSVGYQTPDRHEGLKKLAWLKSKLNQASMRFSFVLHVPLIWKSKHWKELMVHNDTVETGDMCNAL